MNCVYFMFTSMSTTGFGDYTPVGKGVDEPFMFSTTVFILFGIGLLGRVITNVRRKMTRFVNFIVHRSLKQIVAQFVKRRLCFIKTLTFIIPIRLEHTATFRDILYKSMLGPSSNRSLITLQNFCNEVHARHW